MIKIITTLTLCLVGALLMTACAPATPEPNDFPPPPAGTIVVPPATAEVSTAVVSSPSTSTTQGGAGQPLVGGTPTSPTPIPPGETLIVTRDDQGKTFTIKNGESFLLKLGDGFTWDVSVSDQSVLSRVINIAVVQGAQGVYQSHQPGSVTLTANGDPLCRQSTPPCMMPSIAFQVTIVVK